MVENTTASPSVFAHTRLICGLPSGSMVVTATWFGPSNSALAPSGNRATDSSPTFTPAIIGPHRSGVGRGFWLGPGGAGPAPRVLRILADGGRIREQERPERVDHHRGLVGRRPAGFHAADHCLNRARNRPVRETRRVQGDGADPDT